MLGGKIRMGIIQRFSKRQTDSKTQKTMSAVARQNS